MVRACAGRQRRGRRMRARRMRRWRRFGNQPLQFLHFRSEPARSGRRRESRQRVHGVAHLGGEGQFGLDGVALGSQRGQGRPSGGRERSVHVLEPRLQAFHARRGTGGALAEASALCRAGGRGTGGVEERRRRLPELERQLHGFDRRVMRAVPQQDVVGQRRGLLGRVYLPVPVNRSLDVRQHVCRPQRRRRRRRGGGA